MKRMMQPGVLLTSGFFLRLYAFFTLLNTLNGKVTDLSAAMNGCKVLLYYLLLFDLVTFSIAGIKILRELRKEGIM